MMTPLFAAEHSKGDGSGPLGQDSGGSLPLSDALDAHYRHVRDARVRDAQRRAMENELWRRATGLFFAGLMDDPPPQTRPNW
jgi:hypothetical protein